MSMKTLPGTPKPRDIEWMAEDLGNEAVALWLLMQMWYTRKKAGTLAAHLRPQWLATSAWYAQCYQELMMGLLP